MKKLILSIATIATLASCGGETKVGENTEAPIKDSTSTKESAKAKVCKKGYDFDETNIGFAGFKTTEKKPVKGYFKTFKVESTVIADTPEEIFANATISIPVNSIETKDVARNRRLRDNYFGSLSATESITGKIKGFEKDSSKVNVELTLNEIAKTIALDYRVNGDSLFIAGTLNILDFNGQPAIDALNEVCEALHKGADGVSKTWAEVDLNISTVVKEACE